MAIWKAFQQLWFCLARAAAATYITTFCALSLFVLPFLPDVVLVTSSLPTSLSLSI
jgi:hypothetical protein